MTSALKGLRSSAAFAREYLHQDRTSKRLLGIDFGSWKTGVALYDPAVSLRHCEELVTLKAQQHLVAGEPISTPNGAC